MKGGGLLCMNDKPNRWIRTPASLQVPLPTEYEPYGLLLLVSSRSELRLKRWQEA